MKLSRRTILQGAGGLAFAVANFRMDALAQTPTAAAASEVPPILFVHGNGDTAAHGGGVRGGTVGAARVGA